MVSRLEFATRDPERAVPVLSEFFPDVQMSNPRGSFAFEVSSAQAESFSLIHYHLQSPRSSSSADMAGTVTVGMVRAGHVALTAGRRSMDTTQPWLFPQQPVQGGWDEVTITAVSVSVPDLVRFARRQLGDDRFHLQISGTSPIDAAHGSQWAALIEYTRTALAEEGPMMRSEIVRSNAFAHIASMLLSTFPGSFMDAAAELATPMALPSAVRRAVQYMEENAHAPITIEDIARESRMSVRGLQYAFRNAFEITPTGYLRRVRLAGAHQELRNADPLAGDTVLGIALSWGFTHPGRFARQYRDAYGVPPRQTLDY